MADVDANESVGPAKLGRAHNGPPLIAREQTGKFAGLAGGSDGKLACATFIS